MALFDFVVYGNNIGALASSIELSKKYKVAFINDIPNWGAHFAGISVGEHRFDIGMNFFEFTTFHKPSSDLANYDPAVRNDSARFFELVEKFVSKRIDYVEVDKIELLSNGEFVNDIIMANSLDILKNLPTEVIGQIKIELETILASDRTPLHASQKKVDESLFLEVNFKEVSLANHGQTLHDLLIEPICKKIFNISTKDVPALFHRIAWLPLFYPETLLEGINGIDNLAPTKFHYPKEGNFSAIIDAFMLEIRKNENITIFTQKMQSIDSENGYTIKLADESIQTKELVWCSDLSRLLKSANVKVPEFTPQKASVTLAFCLVEPQNINRDFSTLYVSSVESPIYRITNQQYSAKIENKELVKLCVELNYDNGLTFNLDDDKSLIVHINDLLIKNAILKAPMTAENIVIKTVKNAVNHPTLHNFTNFQELYRLTKEFLPNIELVGPASGYVSTSFNDQIVQGLKLGIK
jgi:hypothetical protein